MSHVRTINRVQLTVLLLAISLIPPIFVVTMVATHRPPPEPVLDVRVSQEVQVHTPRKNPDSPRILPCVVIENPTSDTWNKVAVSVNKDFFFYRDRSVEGGEKFSIPLEFFVTKSGNVAFQPGSETVRQVTVYAQLPTGGRAVSENYFDEDGNALSRPGKGVE